MAGDSTESEMAKQFKGLPMSDLIGGPLTAVCEAQMRLAQASYTYLTKIGFQEDGKTTRLIEFDLQRPEETPNGYKTTNLHVQAPFLGLVPLPCLLIEDVNVEFQMEVTTSESVTEKTTKEASSQLNANFKMGFLGSGSLNIQGKVSSSRDNTRSTNQTAKYQVRINARQQQQTEGLSRLMDIMAQCTAALPMPDTKESKEPKEKKI